MNELLCFLFGFVTFACCCASYEDKESTSREANSTDQLIRRINRDLSATNSENAELKQDCERLKHECELLKQWHHDLQQENAALKQEAAQSLESDSVRPPAYEEVFKKDD